MTSTACAACERAADLRADDQRARATSSAPLAVDELAELDPLEVLHHEVERAVGRGARVGDVDDVRVPIFDAARASRRKRSTRSGVWL